MPETMHPDALIEQAQGLTGLTDFDSETFRDGLSVLVSEAGRSPRLTAEGRAAFQGWVVNTLAQRLKVADYVRSHPEVLNERIERPVVVLGAPRTGTTLTSNLLATDPARRSLLTWIVDDPVPPPEADQLTTDPRCLARLEQERIDRERDPSAGRFYRNSAVYPNECIFVMHHDFKSLAWESLTTMPAYADFMMNCDMDSAYDYHRVFLQMLQSRAKGTWNLKMPSHSLHIRWLMRAYPDARLIWTHRDPYTATGSLMSLIAHSHDRFSGGNPDIEWIARNYPAQAAAHVDRMVAFRKARPDVPVHDLMYADMTRDPIAQMRRLYAFLGDPFTPQVEAGMRAWLDENPQGKWGKHAYQLDRFGHSEASLRPLFENYLANVEVEREGF
jgi:hypothetical protein